jgi:hypothetical protein
MEYRNWFDMVNEAKYKKEKHINLTQEQIEECSKIDGSRGILGYPNISIGSIEIKVVETIEESTPFKYGYITKEK